MPSWAIQLIQIALPVIIQEINALIVQIQQNPNNPQLLAQFKTLMAMQADMMNGINAHVVPPTMASGMSSLRGALGALQNAPDVTAALQQANPNL